MEYNFVSEPDDILKCLICLAVAIDPWQHGVCGRLFCEICLNEHGKDKPCPNCRMKKPLLQYFKDSKSKREIGALRVKCKNVESGCTSEATVGTLDAHLLTCKFKLVSCPNKCNTNQLLIKDLEDHLEIECVNREYECPHCHKKATYAEIMNSHDSECEKKVLSCTNIELGCKKTMECAKIKMHVKNDCEYTVISCKYESLGCGMKLMRKDMGKHELDDKAHLHQALNTVVSLKTELRSALAISREGLVRFKVTNYRERRNNNETYSSEPFYTAPDGYNNMCVKVYPNGYDDVKGTHISVYVCILKGHYDDNLDWPCVATVRLELLNQVANAHHHSKTLLIRKENKAHIGFNWGISKFIPHSELSPNHVRYILHLKDDTLYFRVSVRVPNYRPWLECTVHGHSVSAETAL